MKWLKWYISCYILIHVSFLCWSILLIWASRVALVVKKLPANAGDVRDMGLALGSGRFPGGGHGNPLQCSCLENAMDRGAWRATVHGVAKSWIRLKRLSMHARISLIYITASFSCLAKWFSHTYAYLSVLSHILSHFRLLQNIEYMSLCSTVDPCCPSILYTVECIC